MKILLSALLISTSAFAQDPLFPLQWGMNNQGQSIFRDQSEIRRDDVRGTPGVDVRMPLPTQMPQGVAGQEVIVAVIDTGIDTQHPEFAGRLLPGKDFLDNAAMADDMGHGTHVAGIIAANVDGVGIQGVTPAQVKILPLKVLSTSLTGFVYKRRMITDIIADAIIHAIESRASVINMSLGWPQVVNSPRVLRALDLAGERGVVVVAAAGNNNKNMPVWPCPHPAVICVGAMDNQGKITEFTNHGGKVDMVAPGEWIISAFPRALESRVLRVRGYEAKNGASQAAPFVAAAAALLRLQDPSMSVSEVKARLYASSTAIPRDADGRFVRFGALNIQGALGAAPAPMASVLTKSLMMVNVAKNGNYSFSAPLEVWGDAFIPPTVVMQGLDASVSVENGRLQVNGNIPDLTVDNERTVTFLTTYGTTRTRAQVTLSFISEVGADDLLKVRIPGIPAASLMAIQDQLRRTSLSVVSVEDRPSSDYHGYVQARTENTIRVTSVRASVDDRQATLAQIQLPEHATLLAVFEKDVNLDGVNDLVFYGQNTARDKLVLTFTQLNGSPLWGERSRWELPLSTFEGLPLKDGERAGFSWLRVQSPMGEVVVPYYQKAWMLPELDNARTLNDHEPMGVSARLYYWEPYLDGNKIAARPRVVDSVAFKLALRQQVSASSWEESYVERMLPQSQEERSSGQVRHVVSTGEGFFRRFHVLTVTKVGQHSLVPHGDTDVFQAGNSSLSMRKLEDFSWSANTMQFALIDRTHARVKPFTNDDNTSAWGLATSGWNNPFFEVVANFESANRRILMFESRYHVYSYEQAASGSPVARRLSINRESTMVGTTLSETTQPTLIRMRGENHAGLAVNSSLIYGDWMYAMVSTPESLKRPIALSVRIPPRCVPLKNQIIRSMSVGSHAFLCQSTDGEADISFFPLTVD